MVKLQEDQRFSFQIVTSLVSEETGLQATIRALAADKNPNRKIELVKQIDQLILEQTNLIPRNREQTTTEVFDAFQKRNLIPKEVMEFTLTPELSNRLSRHSLLFGHQLVTPSRYLKVRCYLKNKLKS